MSTTQLFSKFPLLPGEEIRAELACKLVADDGTPGTPVHLAHTQWRIGAWHPRSPFIMDLGDITDLGVEGSTLKITYDEDVVTLQTGETEEQVGEFHWSLFVHRCRVIAGAAKASMHMGYGWLRQLRAREAVAAFSAAAAIERFHPGPLLMRHAAALLDGDGHQAARDLVSAAAQAALVLPGAVQISTTVDVRLNRVEVALIAESIGANRPLEQLDGPQALFLAVFGSRFQPSEPQDELIDLLVQKTIDLPICSFILATAVTQWPGCWARALYDRVSAMLNHLRHHCDNAEEFLGDVALVLDGKKPSRARAEALARVNQLAKANEHDTIDKRLLERWADPQEDDPNDVPESAILDASFVDAEAFVAVFSWASGLNRQVRSAERCWAKLRSGRLQDALEETTGDPELWAAQIRQCIDPSDPEVWLSCLTATELLLYAGKKEEALRCIDSGYLHIAPYASDRVDFYLLYASELHNLYRAMIMDKVGRCRLYGGRLTDVHGFRWLESLVLTLCSRSQSCTRTQPQQTSLLAAVDAFQSWIGSSGIWRGLDSTASLAAALNELKSAVVCRIPTVVVGGETSAGKSSFLNSLLETDILYATQEEATAVPTHLMWAPVFRVVAVDKAGAILDSLHLAGDSWNAEPARAFLKKYGFLSSPESSNVARITVEGPFLSIPEGVQLVDTPGLNAHAQRTALAEAVIEAAHACIFVLDARNALKNSEIRNVKWVAGAVGKTIFVINKMDLVVGDDDLDCDANAPEDLLSRVTEELAHGLGVPNPHLFAVSSLSADRIRANGNGYAAVSLEYAHRIGDVRQALLSILATSGDHLVAYAAAKVARMAAQLAYDASAARLADCHKEIGLLVRRLPAEPDEFRSDLEHFISAGWHELRATYVEHMQSHLSSAIQIFDADLKNGLNGCSDYDAVKVFVQNQVGALFTRFVSEIDGAREQEWDSIGRLITSQVVDYFDRLYRDLPFETRFDPARLRVLATPLPLSDQSSALAASVAGMVSDAKVKEVGGAAAGAVIGSFIIPVIGTAIGAVLGGLFGAVLNADVVEKVYSIIVDRFEEFRSRVIAALEADLSSMSDSPPPLLAGIYRNVEQERKHLEALIRERIDSVHSEVSTRTSEADNLADFASAASDWAAEFELQMTTIGKAVRAEEEQRPATSRMVPR